MAVVCYGFVVRTSVFAYEACFRPCNDDNDGILFNGKKELCSESFFLKP
jgi:hypothetical protein